jgi:glucose-1-phosphate cytidylyltransferase
MILAGGKGSRIKEYTRDIPKPLILANGKPLIQYIIDQYVSFGVKNIYILGGYKINEFIKYFDNTYTKTTNPDVFLTQNDVSINVVETGLDSMTGYRILSGMNHIIEENFYLTYGDGLSNVDIKKLTDFHFQNKKIATVTAVRPPARFGSLNIEKQLVVKFGEKNNALSGWINGGFFVLNKKISNYINHDSQTVFEREPLENLASNSQLAAFKHYDFWQPCDTIRDLEILEQELKRVQSENR